MNTLKRYNKRYRNFTQSTTPIQDAFLVMLNCNLVALSAALWEVNPVIEYSLNYNKEKVLRPKMSAQYFEWVCREINAIEKEAK